MASSPEQEIPQEVVDKALEWTLDDGCIGIMDIGDPYYRDLRREIVAGLLAAVLPDLQRPLLEEIERWKGEAGESYGRVAELEVERENWKETARSAQEVVDILRLERDARPDLTRGDILTLMKLFPSIATIPEREVYAKLKRSLDAAG